MKITHEVLTANGFHFEGFDTYHKLFGTVYLELTKYPDGWYPVLYMIAEPGTYDYGTVRLAHIWYMSQVHNIIHIILGEAELFEE
jgi:hypothetical protein